jgi:hypothetical protein
MPSDPAAAANLGNRPSLSRLVPNGARRDVAALREARARGRQVIRGER